VNESDCEGREKDCRRGEEVSWHHRHKSRVVDVIAVCAILCAAWMSSLVQYINDGWRFEDWSPVPYGWRSCTVEDRMVLGSRYGIMSATKDD